MTSSGILAFLADRFNVRSRQEFATEGLGYLLQYCPVVRDIVVNALATSSIVPETRSDMAFISQARSADDSWVVDLEGRVDERVYISVEGKLDAGLQPSQPWFARGGGLRRGHARGRRLRRGVRRPTGATAGSCHERLPPSPAPSRSTAGLMRLFLYGPAHRAQMLAKAEGGRFLALRKVGAELYLAAQ